MTHTKAPWHIIEPSETHGYYIEDNSGATICDLYHINDHGMYHHQDPVSNKANAHLIAAAPDMYATLKFIQEHGYNAGDYNLISDVLNKAEGK